MVGLCAGSGEGGAEVRDETDVPANAEANEPYDEDLEEDADGEDCRRDIGREG